MHTFSVQHPGTGAPNPQPPARIDAGAILLYAELRVAYFDAHLIFNLLNTKLACLYSNSERT